MNTAALADWELTVERTDYTGGSPRGAINAIATNSTGSANAPRGIRSTATSNGSFAYGIESRAVFNGTQSGFDVTKAVSGLYASADNGGQDIMAIGTQSFANTANTDGINLGVMGTARNGASNIGVGGAAGASDAEIATLATTIRTSNVSAGVVGYTTLTGAADYGVAAYAPGSSGKALVASANGTGGTAITAVATNAGGGTGVNVDATTVGVNVTNAVTSFQGTGNLTIDGNSTLGNASGDETTINGFTILAPGTAVTGITSAAAPGTSLGPIDATYLTREVATVSTAPDNFVKLPDGTQDGQLLYLVVSNSDLVDDLIIRNEADIFDYTTVGSDSTVLIHAIWHNGLNRWLIVSVTAQP